MERVLRGKQGEVERCGVIGCSVLENNAQNFAGDIYNKGQIKRVSPGKSEVTLCARE